MNDTEHQIGAKQPGYDSLYKVRKLLDIVTNKFEIEYNLNESVSVDEAMIPFKGRLSFKQYMKDKPVKHGIKVFVLADGKYGYIKSYKYILGETPHLARMSLVFQPK